MPRKHSSGKTILTAGEISTYSLCPESWRLQYVKAVEASESKKVIKGTELHERWDKDLKEANFLTFGTRLICYLILLSIFMYVIPILL